MAFDVTKPVRTRDGQAARIICTDRKGSYPIVAIVGNDDDELRSFTADGKCWVRGGFSALDLVNIPEKHKGWVNINGNARCAPGMSTGGFYETREEADKWGSDGRVACVEIEFEEGQGL